MSKSQQSFNKKEREKKRLKKREEKQKRKEERKNSSTGGSLDDMIAYVDENGMITDTPPPINQKKSSIKAKEIEISIPKQEKTSPENGIYTGKVAFFNYEKGYGFINDSNSSEQYFVHKSSLMDEVDENDKVSFELEKGLKGLNAIRVKKV